MCPKVDEVEFVNNWMMQTHGKANTALVMKFAKNSGSTVDWWLDKINPDTLAKTRIQFWPDNEYTVHQLNNGMHYYTGTLEWWENYWRTRQRREEQQHRRSAGAEGPELGQLQLCGGEFL